MCTLRKGLGKRCLWIRAASGVGWKYLTTLAPTDYVTYNVTDGELESFGLVEPELTITVDYTDTNGEEQSYTLSISRDSEEISLTVYLDNEDHPRVELKLYRQDGANCLAVVDGESLALVPRSDAVELIEAVNAIVLN